MTGCFLFFIQFRHKRGSKHISLQSVFGLKLSLRGKTDKIRRSIWALHYLMWIHFWGVTFRRHLRLQWPSDKLNILYKTICFLLFLRKPQGEQSWWNVPTTIHFLFISVYVPVLNYMHFYLIFQIYFWDSGCSWWLSVTTDSCKILWAFLSQQDNRSDLNLRSGIMLPVIFWNAVLTWPSFWVADCEITASL